MKVTFLLLALSCAFILAADNPAASVTTTNRKSVATDDADAVTTTRHSSWQSKLTEGYGVSVLAPDRGPHPRVAALAAERNAAAAAGDLELAYEVECRLQAVYQELHPLERAHHRYETGRGTGTFSKGLDADVTIDEGRFLATAADYELGGPMWVTAFNQEDTAVHLYVSNDHGETWEGVTWWATSPRLTLTPLGCVVGEGDSLFVYCFFIDPRGDGGDLMAMRWDPRLQAVEFPAVLAGPDTVTDFAVCRDYKGADYWLYATAANELGPADAFNDFLLRSTDYGLSWAVLDTFRYIRNPHMSASVGSWMFMSLEIGPEFPGNYGVLANSWFWSPDSMWWSTSLFPDTFEVHDVVVAPAFTEPADSAMLWLVYASNRENSGDWNIKYRWCSDLSFPPDWSDTLVLAGHPDYDEYFPDIRNYSFAGNAWMNVCYITEGPSFRAVQRRHAHASTPTDWSEPLTINTNSAGTGSDVKPKLCYSPGAGPGAGAIFTGEGLTNLYWNAPWHVVAVEEGTSRSRREPGQTVCRGTLIVPDGRGAVLFDMSGRQVMRLRQGENDVRGLPAGVYYLRAAQGGAASLSRKLVKQ